MEVKGVQAFQNGKIGIYFHTSNIDPNRSFYILLYDNLWECVTSVATRVLHEQRCTLNQTCIWISPSCGIFQFWTSTESHSERLQLFLVLLLRCRKYYFSIYYRYLYTELNLFENSHCLNRRTRFCHLHQWIPRCRSLQGSPHRFWNSQRWWQNRSHNPLTFFNLVRKLIWPNKIVMSAHTSFDGQELQDSIVNWA